jgi:hypothetical protein
MMHFFFCSTYRWLKSLTFPCIIIVFVFLLAILGTSQSLVFLSLVRTVLQLGTPMLPTWWVKISTYLQSELFLLIIFYNRQPKNC